MICGLLIQTLGPGTSFVKTLELCTAPTYKQSTKRVHHEAPYYRHIVFLFCLLLEAPSWTGAV